MTELPQGAKKIQLKAGKRYSLCSCGKSAVLPFCNGAHKELNEQQGSNYKSVTLLPSSDTEVAVYSATWEG